MNHDVCNGDADGLCALRMWRLAWPEDSLVVTGLKRDIELLVRVQARPGDRVAVFDLSFHRNRDAAMRLLEQGVTVRWFDHHYAGALPRLAALQATIDTDPEVCTAMLVDRALGGAQRRWAIAAAYGDNLAASAEGLGDTLHLVPAERSALRRFGVLLNYNAYGATDADVHLHPAALYRLLSHYADPLEVVRETPLIDELQARFDADLARAQQVTPTLRSNGAVAYVLPDADWSRRVLGSFANWCAADDPTRAQIVLRDLGRGYEVSLRAPHGSVLGADALCREFGGSGRRGAAGIDALPPGRLAAFIDRVAQARWLG